MMVSPAIWLGLHLGLTDVAVSFTWLSKRTCMGVLGPWFPWLCGDMQLLIGEDITRTGSGRVLDWLMLVLAITRHVVNCTRIPKGTTYPSDLASCVQLQLVAYPRQQDAWQKLVMRPRTAGRQTESSGTAPHMGEDEEAPFQNGLCLLS
jgi:hypothetical protein